MSKNGDQRERRKAIAFGVILATVIVGNGAFLGIRNHGSVSQVGWLGLALIWLMSCAAFSWLKYRFISWPGDR